MSNLSDKSISANSIQKIIIQENSYHDFNYNNNQIKNENNLCQEENKNDKACENKLNTSNISKGGSDLKKTSSKLNSVQHTEKNLTLNESPIKSNHTKQESKNSFDDSTAKILNDVTGSFSPLRLGQEAASVYQKFNYEFSSSDYFFIDLNDIIDLKNYNFHLGCFNALLSKITEICSHTK